MPRRYPATLKWSFLNQFNPHPPFISCTQSHPISQDDEGPSDSSCAPRSISCTQRGKTGNRLLFGQRIEQKAHTSQSQFEPVVLLCSPPPAKAGAKTRRTSLTPIFGPLTRKGLVKVNGLQTKGI